MVTIRRARPSDAAAMAAVHVASWRATYAGLLPADYLSALSPAREAAAYHDGLVRGRGGHAGFVAVADGAELPGGGLIGFATGGLARRPGLSGGEVETLYVLDDFRDRGLGRRLMRAMGSHLASLEVGGAYAWVLELNPARYFYERLGASFVAREPIHHGGASLIQRAYAWEPISALLSATAQTRAR